MKSLSPKAPIVDSFVLNKKQRWLLLISQCFTLLSLVTELTVWMIAIIGLCLLWQTAYVSKILKEPNKYLIFLVATSGAVVIAISGRELGLLLSMIHLICFAYAIKSMELKSRKDFFQLIMLSIFLLACAFIFRQSVWFALIIFSLFIINLMTLYFYFAGHVSFRDGVQSNLSMVMLSIPLALAMFVLFPRLQPFWQMPVAKSAKTGLGDQVSPGDIANLARSDELAFRVNFKGDIPTQSQMYWRAMTLPYYNGRGWTLRTETNRPINWRLVQEYNKFQSLNVDTSGAPFQYQVIAEPSFQHWLFALDVAQINDNDVFQLPDYSIRTTKPIAKSVAYDVTSYWQAPMELELSSNKQQINTFIPEQVNPRLHDYAKQLRAQYTNDEALIEHVLKHFTQNEYFYTLQPPSLVNNNLDQFFFETKAGFCEHYASTFGFIMRAAGIPARLVTGYLGGEYNPQGNYYSIYQYDAHAWTEVWLQGKGWTRVDPTAAVSPERVSQGLSQTLASEKSALSDSFFSFNRWSQSALIYQFKLRIEAIDYQWTRLVVGYSMEKQSEFLNKMLGSGQLWKVIAIFISALLLMIGVFWLLHLKPQQNKKGEKWQKDFEHFLLLINKSGHPRHPSQTIKQYFQLLTKQLNDNEGRLTCLWLSFYRLSYQPLTEHQKATELALFLQHLRASKEYLKETTK